MSCRSDLAENGSTHADSAYPAPFTVGNLGRNTFEGPGINWTQLSLAKYWNLGERPRFQLRVDANNRPFKQPQFNNPNATYARNTPGSFGRVTGTIGSFSNVGTGNAHILIVGKIQF